MTRSPALFQSISKCFEADGGQCIRFSDEAVLARALSRDDYHAILVDADRVGGTMHPGLARRERRAPLIVIGACENKAGIMELFDAGADDVVLRPLNTAELLLRVHLALRRFHPEQAADAAERLECGPCVLDRRTCTVWVDGQPVRLTLREFAIAWLVFARPGEYVSRRQIAAAVWSSSEDIVGRTLEQHIYKLRKKLGLNGNHGVRLRTMYAHGYRIELDPLWYAATSAQAPGHARVARTFAGDIGTLQALPVSGTGRRTEALATAQVDAFAPRSRLRPAPRGDLARTPVPHAGADLEDALAACAASHHGR
ncbi:response regulator transcription factor [Trinickia caryophylli]|nr:response regulator transcription factor [Trinickia caryophylli]